MFQRPFFKRFKTVYPFITYRYSSATITMITGFFCVKATGHYAIINSVKPVVL